MRGPPGEAKDERVETGRDRRRSAKDGVLMPDNRRVTIGVSR